MIWVSCVRAVRADTTRGVERFSISHGSLSNELFDFSCDLYWTGGALAQPKLIRDGFIEILTSRYRASIKTRNTLLFRVSHNRNQARHWRTGLSGLSLRHQPKLVPANQVT